MARSSTFTSYVNIEPAKGAQAALAQLEKQAGATFARIARQAQGASTATTGVRPGNNGSATTVAAERQRAQALQATVQASNAAAAASGRLASKHLMESNAARAAASSTSALERSLRLASVAANVAQGPLGPLAGRLSAVATAVRELTGLRLGLVGAGALGATFVRAASSAQELKSKLYPLFDSQTQVNAAFKDTIRIANSARLSLEPVVDLYSRLTLGGRDVGLSQARISKLTETAAKAAKLSGGTTQSQDAGLYQFAQGIGSGNLGGDELKSVRENTIRLAKAVADGMGVTIADLKKLGKEGKLTAQVIADALENQRERIDAELAKLPPTIGASAAKLNTAFMQMVSGTDEAYGVTATLAGGLNMLAENLGLVTRAAIGLAIAYASIRAANMTQETYARVSAWQAERMAVQDKTKATIDDSQKSRQASAQRIVELRAERTALQSQIKVEADLAAQARTTRNELTAKTTGKNYGGRSLDLMALAKATDVAVIAEQRLGETQTRTRGNALELHRATQDLSESTRSYRKAGDDAKKATGAFATAARGLAGVIGANLLGLALGVGINLLLQFATAQDAAAAAADRMADREAELAGVIDFATGKVLIQNKALRENAALKAQQGLAEAGQEYFEAKAALGTPGQSTSSVARFGYLPDQPADRAYNQTLGQLQTRRINGTEARRQLMAQKAPKEAFDRLDRFESAQMGVFKQALGARIFNGDARPIDYEMAGMPVPGAEAKAAGTGTGTGTGDGKVAKGRRDRAAATDEATKAEKELDAAQALTEKRTDILSRYEEQSSAMRKAADDARALQAMIGKDITDPRFITDLNPVGKGLYSAEMAAEDKSRIEFGVRQPLRDLFEEQRRGNDIIKLRLEGYDLEATALEKLLSKQDDIGEITRAELETQIAIERQTLRVNDAYESRQRQVSQILDLSNQTRDSFENMLVGFQQGKPLDSIKQFGNDVLNNVFRMQARQITEKLFAGADEKLRDLVSGSNGVDRAAQILKDNIKTASDPLPTFGSAVKSAAAEAEEAANRFRNVQPGGGGGVPGFAPIVANASSQSVSLEDAFDAAFGGGKLSAMRSVVTSVAGVASGVGGVGGTLASLGAVALGASNDNSPAASNDNLGPDGEIVVAAAPNRRPISPGPIPSTSSAIGAVFSKPIEKLTDAIGLKLPGTLGKTFGKAVAGVGLGVTASGVLGAVGIKQNQTAAAIGGAIGNAILPGIGGVIGGALFGTIGGLFQKTKTGSATLGKNEFGYAGITGTGGNDAATTKAVSGLGGSVNDQLNQIADAFGGGIGSFNVSIGKRGEEYRVSGSGGDTTGKKAKDNIVYKGKDEEAAIAAAVQDAIEDGAIAGISAAAQKILKSGQNLQTAITKALAIESIPKRLMQKTDPVRYAVTELNREFTKLIAYLKEGGATAEQFAEASTLYELERVDAIKAATQQSVAAIQSYMDEMTGGSSSPFNKRTVYENAASKLTEFRGDINAGKTVDQNALLTAAKNFQDASQKLYGSSESFFQDFNDLFALLGKARDNVGAGASTAPLPDSPFNSPDMSSYLSQINQTTQNQTDILSGKLDDIVAAILNGSATSAGDYRSYALGLLPGVGQAA